MKHTRVVGYLLAAGICFLLFMLGRSLAEPLYRSTTDGVQQRSTSTTSRKKWRASFFEHRVPVDRPANPVGKPADRVPQSNRNRIALAA